MEKLNKTQVIGIGIVLTGIAASFFVESTMIGVPMGALTAVGVALVFKWIPFRKTKN